MAGGQREKANRTRRAAIWIGALLVLIAVLVMSAQVLLKRQLDTAHVQRRLEGAIAKATDSLYHVRIGSARFSFLGRSFLLTDFELFPDTAAFARRSQVRTLPRTRYRVSAASLRFEGIPLWPIFGRQFVARTAALDSLRVDIRLDKTKPRNPKSVTRLPQHYVLGMTEAVRIARLELTRSAITYSERKEDGTRFGSLPIDSVEATISNLSNARRGQSNGRSVFDVRALLAGAGPLVARFEYDLGSERLNLSYRGNVSRMDARAFNPMLVDVEGMRVRSGQLDSAWFEVEVKDDLATGALRLRYHDFEIETLDKRTGDRSFGDVIRTFFANTFKLHGNNPSDDEPARTAPLRLERAELPLFTFIWYTLRAGIFQIVGLKGPEA